MVETTGIVTGVGEYGFFMQDFVGPWNGIWIVDFGDAGVSICLLYTSPSPRD